MTALPLRPPQLTPHPNNRAEALVCIDDVTSRVMLRHQVLASDDDAKVEARARQVLAVLEGSAGAAAVAAASSAGGGGGGGTAPYKLSRELRDPSGDKAEVRACTFLANGCIATGAQNNKVLLFPPFAAPAIGAVGGVGAGSSSAGSSAGAAAAAAAAADRVRSAPLELLEHERTSRGLAGITAVTATAANQVVSAGKDGKVVVWAADAPHAPTYVLAGGHSGSMTNAHVVATICTTSDKTGVISGGWDTNAVVWDLSDPSGGGGGGGAQKAKLSGHGAAVLGQVHQH